MKFRLVVILSVFMVFLYGCTQPGQIFVPTDVIPISDEPVSVSEEPVDVTGEVTEEKEEEPTEVPDDEVVAVEPVKTAPELPVVEVLEGGLVQLDLQATDPDGDPVDYSYNEPLDDLGMWQTELGDAGDYRTTIVASDGESEVSQDIIIRVLSVNKAPVISITGLVTVDEGSVITLTPTVTDADGDDVSVSYSGFMSSASYKTTFNDAGDHTVRITATDGVASTSEEVRVVVRNVNRAPILGGVDDVMVTEGDLVNVNAVAADPDKDEVIVSFSRLLDSTGQWQTELGDAGTYEVVVTASDGDEISRESFTITVENSNRPPVISGVPAVIEVDETEQIKFEPVVTDPDGDEVTVSYSGFMEVGSYTTTYNDGNDDPSEYSVLISATDGINVVTKEVTIKVFNKNRPPVFVVG